MYMVSLISPQMQHKIVVCVFTQTCICQNVLCNQRRYFCQGSGAGLDSLLVS